jgi:hypothetical protein
VIDGAPAEVVTPTRLPLPIGGAAVIGFRLDGYKPVDSPLSYHDGTAVPFDQKLEPLVQLGELEVSSTPAGAAIELNGRATGQKTPAVFKDLEAGPRYDIRLSLQGYTPATGATEVKGGSRSVFASTLVAIPVAPVAVAAPASSGPKPAATPAPAKVVGPPGKLVVSAVPPDCVVFIDGVKKGNAPVSVSLPPGSHRVKLEQFDGTVAKEFSVQIVSDEEVTRVWDLESRQFISE